MDQENDFLFRKLVFEELFKLQVWIEAEFFNQEFENSSHEVPVILAL